MESNNAHLRVFSLLISLEISRASSLVESLISSSTVLATIVYFFTNALYNESFLLCAVLAFPKAYFLSLFISKDVVRLEIQIFNLHHDQIIISNISILYLRVYQLVEVEASQVDVGVDLNS